MESFFHVGKTELARQTRQIIRAAQRGQTIIIENHGQPEVAIIDIVDYHILRALAHYHARPSQLNKAKKLSDEVVKDLSSMQDRFDLVLAYYLSEEISLGRVAELLGIPWLDLRTRFLRLDVPLRSAPNDLNGTQLDVDNINSWFENR
ncbi:MAG: type II toxin-antitoxin system prevent-host-death family antitoxin [Candidatus Promineifilaceae bacterium]|jgi:prevent-host-death family protein